MSTTPTTWQEIATATLTLRGSIGVEHAERLAAEAVADAELAGTTPEDAYGDPRTWGIARIEELREDDPSVFEETPSHPTTPRGFVLMALTSAATFTVAFTIFALLRDGFQIETTHARWLLPLLLALTVTSVITVFGALQRSRGFSWAVAAAAGVGAALTALTIGVAWTLRDAHWQGPTLVMLLPAVGYGLLAWALAKLWPSPAPTTAKDTAGQATSSATEPLDDAAWAESFARTLRARADHTDAQVDASLTEARAHVAQSGTTLAEEFGSPTTYAHALPQRRRVSARRSLYLTAFTGLCLATILAVHTLDGAWGLDGRSFLYGFLTLFWGLSAAGAVRAFRSARPTGSPTRR